MAKVARAFERDKVRYVRITSDGLSCLCTPAEVSEIIDGLSHPRLEDVWMTQAEYENLPEFMGW